MNRRFLPIATERRGGRVLAIVADQQEHHSRLVYRRGKRIVNYRNDEPVLEVGLKRAAKELLDV